MNIKDVQFREYAERSRYPFTEGSTYKAANGRQIPLSVFVDAILYPPSHSSADAYISRIYREADVVRVDVTRGDEVWSGVLDGGACGCTLRTSSGAVVGTLTLNAIGEEYLKGIAKTTALSFAPSALRFRPDLVIPRPRKEVSVEVEGVAVVRHDVLLTAKFEDSRYSVDGDVVSLDNRIGIGEARPVITVFNGEEVGNRAVHIRTSGSMNLQIVSSQGGLMFHKRGDKE